MSYPPDQSFDLWYRDEYGEDLRYVPPVPTDAEMIRFYEEVQQARELNEENSYAFPKRPL